MWWRRRNNKFITINQLTDEYACCILFLKYLSLNYFYFISQTVHIIKRKHIN